MIYVICIMDIFRNNTLLFQKSKKYKLLDYNSFQYFIDGGEGGEIFSRIDFDKWFKYERD